MKGKGLSGNQLKLIAMVCMTVDHVGLMLLPQCTLLRIIGRLAFPIYAYMIAEGCRYTRSMGRYLSMLLLTAAVCQTVYFCAMGSVYLCIMVTFSISVSLIWLLKLAQTQKRFWVWLLLAIAVYLTFFVAEILPALAVGSGFGIDYGFIGILLPVAVYLFPDRKGQLLCMTTGLALLSGDWGVQWWSLLAVPLLALYNGQRGKWKLKWLFYLYYPAHLGGIWLIGQVIDKLGLMG